MVFDTRSLIKTFVLDDSSRKTPYCLLIESGGRVVAYPETRKRAVVSQSPVASLLRQLSQS
jgi:hypothetical protein